MSEPIPDPDVTIGGDVPLDELSGDHEGDPDPEFE